VASAALVGGIALTAAAAGLGVGAKRLFGRNAKYLRKTKRYMRLRKKGKKYRQKAKSTGKARLERKANRIRRRAARLLSAMQRIYQKMKPEDRKMFNGPTKVKRSTDAWLKGQFKVKVDKSSSSSSSLSESQEAQVEEAAAQTNHARRTGQMNPVVRRAQLYRRLSTYPTSRLRDILRSARPPMVKSVAMQIVRERRVAMKPQERPALVRPPLVRPPVAPRPAAPPVFIRPRLPSRPVYVQPLPIPRIQPRPIPRPVYVAPPAPAPVAPPAPPAPPASQSSARRPGRGGGGFGGQDGFGAEPAPGALQMTVPPGYELTPTFWGAISTVAKTHPVKTALLGFGAVALAVRFANPIKGGISEAGYRLMTPR